MLRCLGHPLVVGVEQDVDSLEERVLRQLGQGQPASRVAKPGRVGVGAKGGHATGGLPESLEALEHGLRVVKDGGPGVEGERLVGNELGAVPAVGLVPADADHVLGEDAAEPGVGEESLALLSRDARADMPDLELEGRGGHGSKH